MKSSIELKYQAYLMQFVFSDIENLIDAKILSFEEYRDEIIKLSSSETQKGKENERKLQ